ncbi:response regulator transcription factor [Dehalogenimonas etheniformans]|uniref:DNA-binding response regulator n=1 Tax=Dehalogenimonas etheniformans TaxID=1536648 RepID=A0A2P5P810_9CHLR|nr:response regulator transcription factor [Dehalogenimonas etheniformans]PPD58415.1 DNA-binding response regulator [Dehalogenimonas etheniformans]QNT76989.1 response regulator transcription factor [Dehalogenimonas etheniformans]
MKILVVTDDAEAAATIIMSIRFRWPNSNEVLLGDGSGFLTKEQLIDVSLIIIDGAMQNTMAAIMEIRRFSEIPIIFVSEPLGTQIDTAHVLSMGKSDYVFKPIIMADLVFAIETITDQSKELPNHDLSRAFGIWANKKVGT